MKSTYSITEAQARFPGLVREASDGPVIITRHDKTVAYILSKQRMDAMVETLELLARPEAMKALTASRAGTTRYTSLADLDEG
ncbi:MAG TPA: type II toxin-antitoxin system prevent-host-death family antitoxin [Kiritimatiellia bacterium]|nr:type II toxin-antitoxin system prevent-host-death family antitoxin [Kiritimatiellia bacterium]